MINTRNLVLIENVLPINTLLPVNVGKVTRQNIDVPALFAVLQQPKDGVRTATVWRISNPLKRVCMA